ncbi:hypothetical protein Sa4125_36800 [Aureimonas sp. SA4125]|uniref:DUF2125 domain-containing protein n=1 Tax=Aureimonas sp. SA4125 TaxID=2826993 RepID=UPI001CC44AEE|nr:DUF2125 domain-containing protein [Aureimonas sp. SA4125]BDA86138.1 hypothetical protein Sa4125_36800 [Aureimonas sp. SA4125]
MTQSRDGTDRSAQRAFVWILVVVIVLAAALTGAWYYLANRLDVAVRAGIETAGGQGVAIACDNRSVFGYPFRLGLRCDAIHIDAPAGDFSAGGGALRTAAQIYQPNKVVAELDGPVIIDAERVPPLDIRWTLAQASMTFRTRGLDHFALLLENPVLALSEPANSRRPLVQSDRLEVHARRRNDSLDLAVTDRGVRVFGPTLVALPAFDTSVDLTVEGAADWLDGRRDGTTLGEALAGKTGVLRSLRLDLGGASAGSAEVSGPFRFADDHTLSGAFDIVVSDPQAIAALVAAVAPEAASIAGSLASGVAFAGTTENGRTTIRITVADGQAMLGVIPLGTLPPLH